MTDKENMQRATGVTDKDILIDIPAGDRYLKYYWKTLDKNISPDDRFIIWAKRGR